MADPTYFLARKIFEDAGFQGRLYGIPEDDSGLDVNYLRRQLAENFPSPPENGRTFKTPPQYKKLFRHVIYCVPTFSNPSGKTYTIERRKEMVELARQKDALIVCDDCYDFLKWAKDSAEEPLCPPRLTDIDHALPGGSIYGNTASNGSFSKVIGPGIRCGWLVGTPAFIADFNSVYVTIIIPLKSWDYA